MEPSDHEPAGSAPDSPPAGPVGAQPDPLSRVVPPLVPGERVTVRHRLADGSATDVIGWVERLDHDQILLSTVADADRPSLPISRRNIILARRVPPARGGVEPSRFSAEELQRIAVTGWVDHAEPLGDWLLRSADGFSRRANSCLAVGDPGDGLDHSLKTVIDFYRERGLPPLLQVITDDPLRSALVAAGWRAGGPDTDLMVIKLSTLIEAGRPTSTRPEAVQISDRPSPGWLHALLDQRSAGELGEAGRRVLAGSPPIAFAEVAGDRAIAPSVSAIGRGHLHRDWLGVSAVWTHPERRRRGLADAVVARLSGWAARQGARYVYLQVERDNLAAQNMYRRRGFVLHHGYCYLRPPD